MKAHEKRVVGEHKELTEKIASLKAFLDGDTSAANQKEIPYLYLQLKHMKLYAGNLKARIDIFNAKPVAARKVAPKPVAPLKPKPQTEGE